MRKSLLERLDRSVAARLPESTHPQSNVLVFLVLILKADHATSVNQQVNTHSNNIN